MPPLPPRPHLEEDDPQIKINDERTPLLAAVTSAPLAEGAEAEVAAETAHHGTQPNEDEDEAPLDLTQIFLLCYTRLVEPVAFFAIFPYINFMIEKTGGVAKEDVGFYSGLIESLFSATQMCVMIFWGRAADRFGRKPILALSLYGVSICTALFGLSQSLWQMIFFRCLAGVFSGTVVTVRVMLTENSTKSTQARVFSYFAFVGNMGIFVGPLIGSSLERPADKFSSLFGHVQFFNDFPYALPGFVTAFVGLSAAILVTLFVKETLHVHHDQQKSPASPMTTWELFKYPGVAQCLLIYNYCMLLAFAFTAVLPVFMYTPIPLGGLSLSSKWIGIYMALGGAAQAFWLLALFPPLHRRIGTGGVLRFCAFIWPIFFAVDPACNLLRRQGLDVPFWIAFTFSSVFGCSVAMAFTCVQLAINDISPSHESFGTLNALSLALQSGLRAVAPAASTALYAIGVKYRIFYGQLFWVVVVVVAIGFIFIVRMLPEKAQGRPKARRNGQA
ncbi:MFS general substrate transporter [Bimuria novae-zelandiae CBS 107.79]|uniref:MFS general substrate transporter n=1 Tax=Bimuria novae-zelandiae CBS 107.79 TaxID=1447943 RepID=A0A6A5V262_9PLEO|nr:MFS general substrate transporter [Bimuria novae-zelandiae CBS 107.79]